MSVENIKALVICTLFLIKKVTHRNLEILESISFLVTVKQKKINAITRIICYPTSKEAGDARGAGRGRSWDSWPQLAKGMSHTVWCQSSSATKLRGCRLVGAAVAWELSEQLLMGSEQLFSFASLVFPPCPPVLFPPFLVFWSFHCLKIFNCLSLNPWVYWLLPSNCASILLGWVVVVGGLDGGVSESVG